ncbi:MAG: hypothetical protein ACTSSP_04000 [Candidatus Asgardarchaeia archaeon]
MKMITIKEAIETLQQIQKKHGDDVKLHMEIGRDESCNSCGQSEYRCETGMCTHISVIDISSEGNCVYLLGEED